MTDWISPLATYVISQPFIPGQHYGVDMAAPDGTPIVAPRDGTVVYVSPNELTGGNVTNIDHADGYQTRYDHQSEFNVEVGQTVVQGQLIGRVGHGGLGVTGPHLHYEVHLPVGHPIDPAPYLIPAGATPPGPSPAPPVELQEESTMVNYKGDVVTFSINDKGDLLQTSFRLAAGKTVVVDKTLNRRKDGTMIVMDRDAGVQAFASGDRLIVCSVVKGAGHYLPSFDGATWRDDAGAPMDWLNDNGPWTPNH